MSGCLITCARHRRTKAIAASASRTAVRTQRHPPMDLLTQVPAGASSVIPQARTERPDRHFRTDRNRSKTLCL
jgi:hypothetical protein